MVENIKLKNYTNHRATDIIASTHLGKKSETCTFYNPSLLVAIPREENRNVYGIEPYNLPFDGCDVWHAYEFSALTENGLPFTRLLKLAYSPSSLFLVESKSLKLYLNSFNMTKFGKTIEETLDICKNIIKKDLSEKLHTDIKLDFINPTSDRVEIFKNFTNIMDIADENVIKIDKFSETPELLQIDELEDSKKYYLHFDSLRSNCRVTHQPDFGDVFIYYKSKKHIREIELVQYLCSFRTEYHFHEECCEMIYKRLHDLLNKDDELFVCTLYTRRGGIDICPARWSKNCTIEDIWELADTSVFARNGLKQ